LVRGQDPQTVQVADYPFVVTESPTGGNFVIVPLAEAAKTLAIQAIQSQPSPANEPLAALHDGRLAENYGPVFRNDIVGGMYRVDLGSVQPIAAVRTWSYHQHGKRGHQHFTLYGSDSADDPGWDVGSGKRYVPIASVHTIGTLVDRYQATSVQRGERPLGSFRWLLWVVRPVTAIRENTAFQEIQVLRPGETQ
jgi:hypothetical protein